MDVYEAIEKRRTIRGFSESVSEELLRKIMLAGTRAPSSANRQPWEFIIVDDPKIIDQLAELKYQQNRRIPPKVFGEGVSQDDIETVAKSQRGIYRNSSVVAVCHKKGFEAEISAWLCIENMALAATAEGLGIVPSSLWGEHKEAAEKLLGLPEKYGLTTVMLIGVQKEDLKEKAPAVRRRPDFSWLHRNRFGVAP